MPVPRTRDGRRRIHGSKRSLWFIPGWLPSPGRKSAPPVEDAVCKPWAHRSPNWASRGALKPYQRPKPLQGADSHSPDRQQLLDLHENSQGVSQHKDAVGEHRPDPRKSGELPGACAIYVQRVLGTDQRRTILPLALPGDGWRRPIQAEGMRNGVEKEPLWWTTRDLPPHRQR